MSIPNLPPLASLRAFEAAARRLSFTKAADELGMTQAAVSYQVRLLEEKLGTALFLRRPRRVELTEQGLRLAARMTEAFDIMRDAVEAVTGRTDDTLVVSCNTTFATMWLATHLGDFQLKNPALAVRLIPYNRDRDFGDDDTDVAIVARNTVDEKLRSHTLLRGVCAPMLSPALAASIGGVREPSDLLKLPIIDPHDPWWGKWFRAAGIPDPAFEPRPPTQMGAQVLEANRAIAGQGVAILTPFFYRDAVRQGLLVQPFDLVCEIGMDWRLVYPESRRNARKVRLFRDWIVSLLPGEGGSEGE